MNNLGSLLILLLIVVSGFTTYYLVASNINDVSRLDDKSQNAITTITLNTQNDFNITNLNQTSEFNNSNPQDLTSFTYEFTTLKGRIDSFTSSINKVTNLPEILLTMAGFDTGDWKPYTKIMTWFIGILIIIAFLTAIWRGLRVWNTN